NDERRSGRAHGTRKDADSHTAVESVNNAYLAAKSPWLQRQFRTPLGLGDLVTLGDGKTLIVRRFDDRWISAENGDVSYELDRQNGNLTYASSTMKDGIATIIIGAGRCKIAAGPAG